jgi:V/A-type H+-transporting ATPase subunit I
MRRLLLLVPRRRLDDVLEAVADLGVLHILDLSRRAEWSSAVEPCHEDELRRKRQAVLRQVEAVIRFFAPPPVSPRPDEDSLPDPALVEREVERWAAEMEALRRERVQLHEEIDRLSRAAANLAALATTGIEPERLREIRLLHAAACWVGEAELPRLEEALAHVPHRLVVAHARGSERLLFAFVLARELDTLDRALRSAGCVPLEVPEEAAGAADEAERAAEGRLAEAHARLAKLEERFAERRCALARPLARARAAAERALLLVEAGGFASRSESVVFLEGWVPADRVSAVRAALRKATEGRCYLRADEPLSVDSVRLGAEPVPILFRNPALVRPFERLTGGFGVPRWREIDPTPLVAVAFWIMFGLMFGDVGHGAVLAGAGLWIFRHRARYRDYGVILMECGVASMVFGFAYGSVFGFEGVLPALWFRPMHDVPRLLEIGAGFGLVMLSLSFALGVVNAAMRREWRAALLGSHGLLAAFIYWTVAALLLRWLATGAIGVDVDRVTGLLALPLVLFWVLAVATQLGAGDAASRSPVAALLGGSIEVIDFLVRGVSNTVSFVRLAAFAISHAGLLLAVFALAEALAASESRLGTLGGGAVLVIGNVVVIALEGLIVSIQTVRLVYYEFFTRFHEGSGLPYRPLRLREHGGEQEAT